MSRLRPRLLWGVLGLLSPIYVLAQSVLAHALLGEGAQPKRFDQREGGDSAVRVEVYLGETYRSKTVYLVRHGYQRKDTLAVYPAKERTLKLGQGLWVDTLHYYSVGYQGQFIPMVLEPGTIHVDLSQEQVSGTRLNDLSGKVRHMVLNYAYQYHKAIALPPEEYADSLARERAAKAGEQVAKEMKEKFLPICVAEANNALGIDLFTLLLASDLKLSDAEIETCFAKMSPLVRQLPQVQILYQNYQEHRAKR